MNEKSSYLRLEGKVAVVTGAAGIIGKVLVQRLVEFGALVALIDIDKDGLEQLKKSVNSDSLIHTYTCDLSKEKDIVSCIDDIYLEFGKIDILFNNAATKTDNLLRFFDPVDKYSMETWRAVMSVNMDGMFIMARKCADYMAKQNGGVIVQTASIYGAMAPDMRIYEGSLYLDCQINTPPVYAASKGGIIALTQYLSSVWAKDGIRVNAISPGGISSGQNDTFEAKYSSRVPMGRMATTLEIVDAALFLASPASSYITGQNLMVDGGLSAW